MFLEHQISLLNNLLYNHGGLFFVCLIIHSGSKTPMISHCTSKGTTVLCPVTLPHTDN